MQVDLTNNIKAIVLPDNARKIFIENTNSCGTKYLWYWDGGKSIEITLDFSPESKIELLGVIEGGEIQEELATEVLKGIGHFLSSNSEFLFRLMANKGVDLSKTIVIIKTE